MNSDAQTAVGKLQLSMFERVVISVIAAAMLWVGVQVSTNAIAIAKIEERTQLISSELAILRRKVDVNILPLADQRLNRVETEIREIHNVLDKLERAIIKIDDTHNHPTQR